MKKIALFLVVVLVLSMALSSCGVIWQVIDPKDTEALWDRVDKKMSGLKSYRIEVEADISFEYMGSEVKGEMAMTTVTIGDEDDEDPYYYNIVQSEMSIDGSDIENSEDLVVYEDGKMYISKSSDGQYSHIYSALTPEEFDEFNSGDDSVFDMSPENAKTKDMEELEGGEWSLSFSGFDKDDLDDLVEDLGFDAFRDNMGVDITDVSVKLTTDKKFRVKDMTVDFLSSSSEVPFVSMTAIYSEYNEAEKMELDKSGFVEVDDARVAEWVSSYLTDATSRENVVFDLEIEQNVKVGSKVYYSYKETDTVNFKNKNGSFTYNIEATVSGQKATIEYALGTQTISSGGKTQTVAQSALEASAFIGSLMNVAGYEPLLVEDITKTGDNLYTINLVISDLSEYKSLMTSLNDRYKSDITYIIVEMDEEDVKSIETYIKIVGSTYTYTATSKMEITED